MPRRHRLTGSAAPVEAWHTVASEFLNSWRQAAGGVAGEPLVYRKVEEVVHLVGRLESTGQAGQQAIQMPVGYQPGGGGLVFSAAGFDGSAWVNTRWVVSGDGIVYPMVGLGSLFDIFVLYRARA